MITVRFKDDGNHIMVSIDGHAGYDEIGRDIVCSASSILAYTMLQTMQDLYSSKALRKKPSISLTDGLIRLVVKPKKDAYNLVVYSIKVIMTGYKLLMADYPEFVQIKQFGEDDSP